MKSSSSHAPSTRALVAAALAIPFLIATLLSSGLPSSAARTRANASRITLPQAPTFGVIYRQTNLVSDLPGFALVEERRLVNPWGVALSPTSPFWVVNNKKDLATIFKGDVSGSPLVPNPPPSSVAIPNIPTVAPAPSLPTGVVANTTNDFLVSFSPTTPAAPAHFIFSTFNGGINAWHPGLGSVAIVVKFVGGHSYAGLAIGNNAAGNFLYAADFKNGTIDIFDKDFNQTSLPGNFAVDAFIPAGYHPFNIQNIGGSLYVTYAQFNPNSNRPNNAPGAGFVRKFDTNGVRDTAFVINNGVFDSNNAVIDAPWGMALAPPNSGPFSNMLLVGNSGSIGSNRPSINAFDPATGALFGSAVDGGGAFLRIDNLWSLVFGNGVNGGDPNTLYFSAGSFSERHGLFGSLKPVSGAPPSTVKFSSTQYLISEAAGHVDITVTRTGDGSATQFSDYQIALGKLTFAPGQTTQTFRVLIVDDKDLAGGSSSEHRMALSNAVGTELTVPNTARINISDDEGDTAGQPPNANDDPQLFVRQQYYDFLNRVPDAAGFDFWVNQITSCGSNQQCIETKRINVSAAFFLSIEFQRTGMLAYLSERAAFGTLPRYGSFMRGVQALQKDYVLGAPGADAQLEANRRAFFDDFVTRPEFVAKYGGLTNDQYVLKLLSSGGLSTTTGRLLITGLNGAKVVPPVNTPAIGLAVGQIGFDINTVRYSLSLKDLSSPQRSAHIHGPAGPGGNAPVLFTLPNGDFTDFPITLTNQQGRDLRDGLLYLDVHTQNHPDGEIRGQVPQLRFIRDVLVKALDEGLITRAQALRFIAEDIDFRQDEFNRAFVLMEYFGYLRRNPDDPPDNNLTGYNFWLNKLNSFNGDYIKSEMVKAFITSTEYRRRFGPP